MKKLNQKSIYERLRDHKKTEAGCWSQSLQEHFFLITQEEYDEFLDKLDPERGPKIYNDFEITDKSFRAFGNFYSVGQPDQGKKK